MFPVPLTPANLSAPAANTAAVVTFAAEVGRGHVFTGLSGGYDGAPTGGSLKVEDGAGNICRKEPVTAAGMFELVFDPPFQGAFNTALIITLAAGGGGVSGMLNVIGHYTTSNRPEDASVLYGSGIGILDFSDGANSGLIF